MTERRYLSFQNDPNAKAVLLKWWAELSKNTGDRAQLRRCHDATEVALTPVYHRLRTRLASCGPVSPARLANVAGVLAHIRTDDESRTIAQQLGGKKKGSTNARLSGLRFRRLLQVQDDTALYTTFMRAVRILDGTANVPNLADTIYWWNEQTKYKMASDYYEAAPEES